MDFKFNGILPKNIFFRVGENSEFKQVKKYHANNTLVWSAEQPVTYIIDRGVTETHNVEYGVDCTNYIPEVINGYEYFIGWSEVPYASGEVLQEKTVDIKPITLYAIFGRDITCSFISYNKATPVQTVVRYNNGDILGGTVDVPKSDEYRGWEFLGWGYPNDSWADDNVIAIHPSGKIHNLLSNVAYFAKYSKDITCRFVSYENALTKFGKAYYCGGVTVGGIVRARGCNKAEGWTWLGWGAAGDTGPNEIVKYSTNDEITDIISDGTYYGKYSKGITLYYEGNGAKSGDTPDDNSGISYMNCYKVNDKYTISDANFTVDECGFEKTAYAFDGKWALDAAASSIKYKPGDSLLTSWNRSLYATWKPIKATIFDKNIKEYNKETTVNDILVGWFDLRKHSTITLNIERLRSPDSVAKLEVYISNVRVFTHEEILFTEPVKFNRTAYIPANKKLESVDIKIHCENCSGRYVEIAGVTLTLNP